MRPESGRIRFNFANGWSGSMVLRTGMHCELTRALLGIWRDLLGVADAGVDGNFFDLGGDSLLGVELFQRAHAITGVNLPLSTLLTAQTVRDDRLATRFDYDAVFGTVLNRFVILAALGHPLTVYGSGNQIRGLIDIRDTCECIRLSCENPADVGEFRVFNQFTEQFSVNVLAEKVANAAKRAGVAAKVNHLPKQIRVRQDRSNVSEQDPWLWEVRNRTNRRLNVLEIDSVHE